MIRDHVRNLIASKPDHDVVELILNWTSHVEDGVVRALPKSERRAFLDQHFETLKRPVLASLSRGGRIRVTNELTGSSQAVVSAPAKAWKELLASHDNVLARDGLDVLPNDVGGVAI